MTATESTIRIGLVYPELLGTYGDRGNAIALVQRARWRGLAAELVEVAADAPIPDSLDAYLLGGGEDDPQLQAAEGLRASRAAIQRARDHGAVVLAVCAGYQLIGHRYVAADGTVLDGLGLIDLETRAGTGRLIGEVVVQPAPSPCWLGDPPPLLTGFENHGGRTTLGSEVQPLGRVLAGGGNGDGQGTDGALAERLVGTYLHGPLLPRNPALADRLLSWIVGDLPPIDPELEGWDLADRLHDERLRAGRRRGAHRWLQDRLLARG